MTFKNKNLSKINRALTTKDSKNLSMHLKKLEPAELTEQLTALSLKKLVQLINLIENNKLADIFSRLSPQTSASLLNKISPQQSAGVLQEMEPDEATDVIKEIEKNRQNPILQEMRQPEQTEVTKLLAHKQETAGAIMTPRYIAVTKNATINEALKVVRTLARQELESIYYLYVLDEKDRLIGVLSLRTLLLAQPDQKIKQIMTKKIISVNVKEDQEEAAQKVLQHELAALPVVNANQKLLGIITHDDASQALQKETSEDIERMAGAEPLDRPYIETPLTSLVKKRIGWLFILFAAQTITGNVLSFFKGTLSEAVALSFFIPLLIGTGGNIGSQTVTLVVRALAIGQADIDDIAKIIFKETQTGIVLGLFLGIVGFLWARFFTDNINIGLTVAVTILVISTFAASIGALIPLILSRLKLDPAAASTPLISTFIDGSGLIIYFLIARLLLKI